jgi:hypothetical protein
MVVLVIVIRAETAVVLQSLLRLTPTGRFPTINHKCCIYATNSSHKCYLALVALCFLRYNIGYKGEIMIKPNTLCMIRGVPHGRYGSEFNGHVVTVTGSKYTYHDGSPVYWIEPVLTDSSGRSFTGCREQWLFPFADPDTLGLTNKALETV